MPIKKYISTMSSSFADMMACMQRGAAAEEDAWHDDDDDDDDDEEAQLSSQSNHPAEAQLFPPGTMDFAMLNTHMQSAAEAESLYYQGNANGYDLDEEAQFPGMNFAAMAQMQAEVNTWHNDENDDNETQANACHNEREAESQTSMPPLIPRDVTDARLDDDEESQIPQPPQVVEVNLPRIEVHANDVAAITSILDSISDPAIKAVLESLIADPEDAHQHNIYNEYVNQPDPLQHSWTPIDVLYDGLLYAGFDTKRLNKNNLKRKAAWFKTFYGVEHTTVSPYLINLKKEYPDINYRDCFMTLNWMTLYEVYPVLSARWKRSEEYIGPKIIECLEKMANFAMETIVDFALKHAVETGRTVDCVTFMIQEMRQDPNTKWFDWKTHSAGLVSYCYFHFDWMRLDLVLTLNVIDTYRSMSFALQSTSHELSG